MKWISSQHMLRGALFTGLLSMPAILPAQAPSGPPSAGEANVMFFRAAQGAAVGAIGAGPMGGMQVEDRVVVVGPMGMMHGGVVKGAPYSATVTTEMVQKLVDGNRITHRNSSKTYRDSEGRTRRDQTLPAVGPFASAEPPSLSFIHDPVAQVTYVLNHTEKTARKLPQPQWTQGGDAVGGGTAPAMVPLPPLPPAMPGGPAGSPGMRVFTHRIQRVPGGGGALAQLAENVRRDELGTKLIDGVEVTGTRTTLTIPAGEIGNELPIEVITEEWISALLKVMVSSRTSDPRVGENTYQLTEISRAEPDPGLFKVPPDYQLVEDGPATFNLAVPAPQP